MACWNFALLSTPNSENIFQMVMTTISMDTLSVHSNGNVWWPIRFGLLSLENRFGKCPNHIPFHIKFIKRCTIRILKYKQPFDRHKKVIISFRSTFVVQSNSIQNRICRVNIIRLYCFRLYHMFPVEKIGTIAVRSINESRLPPPPM